MTTIKPSSPLTFHHLFKSLRGGGEYNFSDTILNGLGISGSSKHVLKSTLPKLHDVQNFIRGDISTRI
jgi:hypothetical protein